MGGARHRVICRQCGTEIADKALICYRCGTATTEAKFKPVTVRPVRSLTSLVLSVVVLAITVLLAVNIDRLASGDGPRIAAWVVAAIAALLVVVTARGRLRRR